MYLYILISQYSLLEPISHFSCFAPYFDLYLNNIERALNDQLTTRLIGDYTVNKSSLKSRAFEDVFRNANGSIELFIS